MRQVRDRVSGPGFVVRLYERRSDRSDIYPLGAILGVGSSEIKNQTIKRRDIGAGGGASSEVADGTLGMRDLNDETKSKINGGGGPGLPGEIQTFAYNPSTGILTITT